MKQPLKRALFVGINTYDNDKELACCVNDALAMKDMLARHENNEPNFSCKTLTSDKMRITTERLSKDIQNLMSDLPGGDLLFYFSGHGHVTEQGGYLRTQDATEENPGFPMSELLALANNANVDSVLLILDCCHSGAIGDSTDSESQITLSEGVTILASSDPGQESEQDFEYSVFTELMLGALDGGATDIRGLVSAASMYAYVEAALGSWDQRPMYKSHARTLEPIRECNPIVSDETLRQLTSYFRFTEMKFQMDPSFEYTTDDCVPENIKIFDRFKELRNAGLLQGTDGKDLYWAAIESGTVELTNLGKFYWRLVSNDKI